MNHNSQNFSIIIKKMQRKQGKKENFTIQKKFHSHILTLMFRNVMFFLDRNIQLEEESKNICTL